MGWQWRLERFVDDHPVWFGIIGYGLAGALFVIAIMCAQQGIKEDVQKLVKDACCNCGRR